MKRRPVLAAFLVTLAIACQPSVIRAQSPEPRPRGDLSGNLAWQLADTGSPRNQTSSDWHSSLFGGGAVGWYWNDHLKTEIDFGASTSADAHRAHADFSGGRWTFRSSRLTFSRRTLAVAQQYQFFENAWFHPHLGAGVQVTWERRVEEHFPVTVVSEPPGRTEIIDPGGIVGPRTAIALRGLVAGGFKAYLTPRAFLRVDTRMAFTRPIDEVLFRIGFGVDF